MPSAEEVPVLRGGPVGSHLVDLPSAYMQAHWLQQGLPEQKVEMPSLPTLSVLGVKQNAMEVYSGLSRMQGVGYVMSG